MGGFLVKDPYGKKLKITLNTKKMEVKYVIRFILAWFYLNNR